MSSFRPVSQTLDDEDYDDDDMIALGDAGFSEESEPRAGFAFIYDDAPTTQRARQQHDTATAAPHISQIPVQSTEHERIHPVCDIMKLSGPIVITMSVEFLIQMASLFYLGRLGPEYMDAATLGNMISNLTGEQGAVKNRG